MTFLEVRNTLVSSLAAALGLPVLLSDQVQPEAEVPFIVYSVTAPYSTSRTSQLRGGKRMQRGSARKADGVSLGYSLYGIDFCCA